MPGFFDTVDEIGIVEDHIQQVLKLEDSEAVSLLRRYKEVRRDLRDRLDRIPGDTFTAQHYRAVLAQVSAAIDAMNDSLKNGISHGTKKAALAGVDGLLSEISEFSSKFEGAATPINLNAAIVADDAANFRLNQYQASIDAYSEGVRSDLTNQLANMAIEEVPYSAVIQRLGNYFTGEEWKLHRIARTELHGIYNLGKLRGMQATQEDYIPDMKKTLMHPMDARTGKDSEYAAELHLVVDINEPFSYTWKGQERVFMAPPDRPNDRAILVPYREEWGKAVGGAFVENS